MNSSLIGGLIGLIGIGSGWFVREQILQDRSDLTPITGQSHFVEREGQRIHVWAKAPADWDADLGRVIVFMHGATYSGRPDFDLGVGNYSVMDSFVRRGWATYAVDAQGYGASDNPKQGSWCTAQEAAKDLAAAVDWICKERSVKRISLLGWSWGCQVVGEFAQSHPERVQALVLQGGAFEDKYKIGELQDPYRTTTAEDAASDFIDGCYEQSVVDAYVAQCLLHDPDSPNGALQDYSIGSSQILKPEIWPWPTLIILGEHEATPARQEDMAKFFVQLASKRKALVIMPGGGHAILLEKPRTRWQGMVADFLEFKD